MQLLFLRVSESTEGGRCTCYNATVVSSELTNWYNKEHIQDVLGAQRGSMFLPLVVRDGLAN